MPYPKAIIWLGLTLLTIIWGFWQSYFATQKPIPAAFHVHAVSALLWVGLLMFQHWSIHGKRRAIHRAAGQLSLGLFPFLLAGFAMIVNVSAKGYATGESEFMQVAGPSFGISMVMAMAAYIVLFYSALKYRRNVRLHAGYMLATAIVLFESPFSRVIPDYFPFLMFANRPYPVGVLDTIALAMLISALFSFVVYWRVKKDGFPFLLVGVLLVIEAFLMGFGTSIEPVRQLFARYAELPEWLTVSTAFALGVATVWAGWTAPNRQGPSTQIQPA
ncbi:hypothetical protein R0135_02435 [Congregibacter variabilis]|uniref:Uncharacterized protein n=1 Tax=Congregibacter variabilis TaxID=3081200 RepID=A0ABZ0I4R5_9GAMM|nr:hypothetical protein R0135_02435 [Congregibacter sp. IMCC43200]